MCIRDRISGAIIMGTGNQPPLLAGIGGALTRVIALFKGWKYRSTFINNMAFGSYNKRFAPARTPYDWLTKDKAIVDAYSADERSKMCIRDRNSTEEVRRSLLAALIERKITKFMQSYDAIVHKTEKDRDVYKRQ